MRTTVAEFSEKVNQGTYIVLLKVIRVVGLVYQLMS